MAKVTFKCSACNALIQKFTSSKKPKAICECGSEMKRQMPKLSGAAEVTEVIDKYSNKKWKLNQKEILEDRKAEYFWSVEVPKKVNSGVYEIDTMLELGWIYFDDKEEIQIRTKPPQRE